jgi:hypothetical protein
LFDTISAHIKIKASHYIEKTGGSQRIRPEDLTLMKWTRSETLALASNSCSHCRGLGLRDLLSGKQKPCECVFRSIFRICYDRFRECVAKEKHLSHVSFDLNSGPNRRGTWGRKDEEYIADFMAIAHRELDAFEHRIFRYHFLLGADWRLCTRQLNLDRGTFFHAVYRIEKKMGRTMRELEPYSLFPLDEYFNASPRRQVITACEPLPKKPTVMPVRPPAFYRFRAPVTKAA